MEFRITAFRGWTQFHPRWDQARISENLITQILATSVSQAKIINGVERPVRRSMLILVAVPREGGLPDGFIFNRRSGGRFTGARGNPSSLSAVLPHGRVNYNRINYDCWKDYVFLSMAYLQDVPAASYGVRSRGSPNIRDGHCTFGIESSCGISRDLTADPNP